VPARLDGALLDRHPVKRALEHVAVRHRELRITGGGIGLEQMKAVGLGAGETAHSTYRFELVPRLWLLGQRRGYRIYQHLSIPDIVDRLLGEHGDGLGTRMNA